ncbi:hypothetical protein KFL_008240080 [Klebsormidium nitens]|uniref:CxC3 like cysteine cluster domain-containing protein n=1 Tax=Klebsormidium nitens TaxID=105231 RepID=A0A1Y1ISA9_KLENI|nr:hypothetical protein KFL_008240080 [Klebsormidium nitens]|eukprot:GAQ91646.1 hypothetical protein KFL_008240080 [Klebsormidium nitens]
MDSSESSEEQLSDLKSPAVSSSSAEQSPPTHLPSKRKHDDVPLQNEEESEDLQSRQSSGRTASRSISGSGAASSASERSASYDGRERVFADGVPVRSAAPRSARRRKAQSKSAPPAQDRSQTQRGGAGEERGGDQVGGRVDDQGGGNHRNDDGARCAGTAGGPGAASVPQWFEEEADEGEAERDWAVRTEREYRAYVEGRPSIAAELLRQEAIPMEGESACTSQGCQGVGILRCQECTGGRAICAECDESYHPYAHFHHRSILKAEGFWSPLSPTQAVVNGQLINVGKCFAQPPLRPCAHCKQTAWGPAQAVSEKWAVVTLEGRFDFQKAAFKCQTENCPCIQVQDGAEALQLGYWVGTVTKVVTLYSVAMLKHWDKTQEHMPGSGLSAFVKILEETGQELGRLGVRRPDVQCGTGEWKAARDTRSAIRGQAETGAVFCGCRHQVGMKAVNLVRTGERFGYTYFLDRHFIQGRHPRFFWQDIVCKYWPWREKALDQMGEGSESGSTKPALNIMHGKLHSWQPSLEAGGRMGPEQDPGRTWRCTSPTCQGRAERITKATLYWNEDKRARMAQSLARRMDQNETRTVEAAQELERLCQEMLEMSASQIPLQKFRDWKSEVQQVAREQLNRSSRAPSAAVKYFTLVTEVEAARELEAFRQSESFEDNLLCSDAVQQVRSLTAEVTRDLHVKEKKVKELERELFGQEAEPGVSEEARQRVLEASRTELAEDTISGLQVEIEALLHSLEKSKLRIASEADSAKMRASMRKKEGEVKKQVEAAVSRYNVVIQKGDPRKHRDPASASDLLAGAQLPWQFEGRPEELLVVGARRQKTVAFKRKVEVVEAFNYLQRLREETRLLAAEQRSVLAYYSDIVSDLSSRIEALNRLDGHSLEDNIGPEGESDRQENQLPRYWVSQDRLRNDRVVRSGCRALLSKARTAAVARLGEAKATFPFAPLETQTAGCTVPESPDPTSGIRLEEEFAQAHERLEVSELARFRALSDRLVGLGLSSFLHRLFRCALSVEQLPDLSRDVLRTVGYFSEQEIEDLLKTVSGGA